MAELGIVDIREIIRVIKSVSNYDFSNHALTSFKQRLERIMRLYVIGSPDGLIGKLQEDPGFFDTFLHEISVPSTEMFRDPSLWRWLREVYFPDNLDKNAGKFRIWIPVCVSGSELFSLAILLQESGIADKVQITASVLSEKSLALVKSGYYDLKKLEVSQENYKRFNGAKDLSSYCKPEKDYVVRNTSLIENVEFNKLNINFDNSPQNVKLILFRNNMIYFNPTLQDIILQTLHRSLSVSGHLILGIRERISGVSSGRDFKFVNETESVYRKKLEIDP
jgi:chemotaxis protein methyltransferase CheR